MNRFGPKAQRMIAKTMTEYSEGRLRSASGQIVTDRQQALAIGISRAKQMHYKVPKQQDD